MWTAGAIATGRMSIRFVARRRLLPPWHLQQLVPAILERFKEKNIVMSKAADESLRALFEHCVAVGDCAEDLVAAMDHKNPKGGWGSGSGWRGVGVGVDVVCVEDLVGGIDRH